MGMGGLVDSAPACYGITLSSNSDIPQIHKWATYAKPAKIINKKTNNANKS
jgi:hypothetical protein